MAIPFILLHSYYGHTFYIVIFVLWSHSLYCFTLIIATPFILLYFHNGHAFYNVLFLLWSLLKTKVLNESRFLLSMDYSLTIYIIFSL